MSHPALSLAVISDILACAGFRQTRTHGRLIPFVRLLARCSRLIRADGLALPGDFFPPIYNCPHELDRLGALGDGGKWMCGILRIQDKPDCVIYSFGTSSPSFSSSHPVFSSSCCSYRSLRHVSSVHVAPFTQQGSRCFRQTRRRVNEHKCAARGVFPAPFSSASR